jgi:ribokinase
VSLFVAGSLHLDVVVRAGRLPRLDETLMGEGVRYVFGGKGGNQAVAAAQIGAAVAMAGRVGRDAFAPQILAALDAAGIDRSQVQEGSGASGMSVAIVDAEGSYGAVVVSGENRALEVSGIVVPPGTTYLLLQNEIPEAANLALATLARATGAGVILNAAPARATDPALLALVDILVVNRVEAADILDGSPGRPEDMAEALARLGPPTVILTLGADGLVARHGGQTTSRAAHLVQVVSTHGAGDCFVGTLAAELDRGADLPQALDFAQGAAALLVSMAEDGRRPPAASQVLAFMESLAD